MNKFDAINSLTGPQTFVDGLSGTWFAVEVGFVASLAFCILLILTKLWRGAFSMDANEGVLKFHSTPTPRIGGLAIVGDVHSWHLYVTQLTDEAKVARDVFIERLFEQGIGCSVHYIPLHLQPYWRDTYKLTPEMFPVSQRVFERTVSLPLYTRMTEADVARVVAAVKVALV